MIELTDLTRTFTTRRGAPPARALAGISFGIDRGEIFGLLGPNGAGKTTTVRILSTLLTPTTGTATVAGLDVVTEAMAVRRRIGVAFGGERGLYDRLSARDNLRFAAQLYDLPRRDTKRRIAEVLDVVGLADAADQRVEAFSRGMKQRLHLARALIHDPEIVFLDEPSSGLDPVAARALRELVLELRLRGKTVLLTTHYMFEADELCDRLAVISEGRVIALDSPERVKASVRVASVLEVDVLDDHTGAVRAVSALPGVVSVQVEQTAAASRLIVRIASEGATDLPIVLGVLADVRTGAAFERRPTLEDAYVALLEERAS
ncbi:ABC transporter ATP-binding protein [Leifsonia sp. ZF2019]|uniref:ABC transporter ATP-binding protein n=1 Tax=Leifsonia sp. ZF2019 TaxID=2781978 RepID=UPI001CBD1928|nr:ABC transporter ATP-binding protein [Leifsonia sp. ZF2019]UAJ79775.1 ABC transporter ATP-binding protein [Leifsonia sp. ZF2019]